MPILQTLYECLLGLGKNTRALEVTKEYVQVLGKVRAAEPLEQGAVDGELVRALFALHDIHLKCGNKKEALEAFNKCEAVMVNFKAGDDADPGLARLFAVVQHLKPQMKELSEKLKVE